jgi:hypothetical protein
MPSMNFRGVGAALLRPAASAHRVFLNRELKTETMNA